MRDSGEPPGSEEEALRRATALAERAACPAVYENVRFGTAGWTDRSLIQSRAFYPPGATSARARLEHYARHFAVVEVDATYYTLLAPEIAHRWVAWTPDSFQFDVKAYPVLTGHPIDVSRLPKDLQGRLPPPSDKSRLYPDRLDPSLRFELERRFFDFVSVLAESNRLGAVLLQFPPWFTATRGNARRIEAVRSRWPAVPFSVEFRHRSWLEPDRRSRLVDLLRDAGMSYVVVDEPDVAIGGVPAALLVTRPELAVVRFHGQNKAGWRKGASVAERFNYLYSPEELAAWSEPVRALSNQAESVHVVFNNCVRNFAVVNAQGLSVVLASSPKSPEPFAAPPVGGTGTLG